MEPSKLYRGRDAAGIWHYGYFVEQWIYGIEKKYVQVDVATVGKAIDVEDKTGTPIYTGDTFEYKGYKFVVEYDKEPGMSAKESTTPLTRYPAMT